jgi:hypothetical protein
MKHPIKFLCFITLLLLGTITCSAQKNAADYLKNQTQRKAMYQAILTNNQYRQELMQEMMQHHKGMGKMQGDSSHMAMMHQMMQMGEQDTAMAGLGYDEQQNHDEANDAKDERQGYDEQRMHDAGYATNE